MQVLIDALKNEADQLHIQIKSHYKLYETDNRMLITDGIVDVEAYYNAPIRIMWILKEP